MRIVRWLSLFFAMATPLVAQDMALRSFEKEAFAALNGGDYVRCSRVMRAATNEHPHEPSPPFVAARCYAKSSQLDKAHHYLNVAMSRGFRNCQVLKNTPELLQFTDSVA